MYKRLLKLPAEKSSSIFLFGPRGTGKTSWLMKNVPKAYYIDLLDFETYSQLSANPSRLETLIPKDWKEWVVIDEVQRVPELLNQVHRLIEHRGIYFILTGSSARSLKRKGVNLLAGRALRYNMHPLTIQELQEDFDLQHALSYGLLPMAITNKNPKKYLASYVQTYLREEVLQEGLTRTINAFSRFLEVASFSQGEVLTLSEIAREVAVSRQIIASYFDILEDLLLAIRIPVFTRRAKRKVVAHQKFYFFDTGVYRNLRPTGLIDTPEEIDGAALETLFLQSVRAINDYLDLDYKIYYWRTTAGTEVDFVLYGPRGFYAFEIKRSSSITSKHLKGLKAFKEDYDQASCYLVHLGKHIEHHDDITVIPMTTLLKQLPDLLA